MQNERHILFADDDADTREMVQLLLRHAGFNVSVAASPPDVLDLIAKHKFDAILLDNWMPQITGIEICERIRIHDQVTPIVFCSGAVTQQEIEAAHLAGAQGYVGKPFDPDELIDALRTAIAVNSKGVI